MRVLVLLLAAWPPLSFALAVLIGRAIHQADSAELESSLRRCRPLSADTAVALWADMTPPR